MEGGNYSIPTSNIDAIRESSSKSAKRARKQVVMRNNPGFIVMEEGDLPEYVSTVPMDKEDFLQEMALANLTNTPVDEMTKRFGSVEERITVVH